MKLLASMIIAAHIGSAFAAEPIQIEDRAQLFVDRTLVADAKDVKFTVHPPAKHPNNPLIVNDQPWERYIAMFGDVIYDEQEQLYKLWYTANPPPGSFTYNGEGITAHVVCYAQSKDGIAWEKPSVGTLESTQFTTHNAVAPLQSPVVWKDLADPDPNRRYKMIGVSRLASNKKPKHPTDTFVSPDGFKWTMHKRDIHDGTQDVVNGFFDEKKRAFVAIPKRWPYPKIDDMPQRVFGVQISSDFETWTSPNWIFQSDAVDNANALRKIEPVRMHFEYPENPPDNLRADIQGVSSYVHESGVVLLPWVFHYYRGFNKPKELRDEGQIELQIATLRDQYSVFDRSSHAPIHSLGKFGEWDSGFMMAASKVIRVGDEVRLYYDGCNYTHGFDPKWQNEPRTITWEGQRHTWTYRRAIGLATWKLNRFVSADAGGKAAVLVTKPLIFTGEKLELNAATKPGGSITVEIGDESGKTLAKTHVFAGDDLRAVLEFADGDIASLKGQPVTLKFHLKDASLFSFAFRK